jgi:3-dehydroquinate synthase
LYTARVKASLRSAGLEPFVCSIPDGEPLGKTLAALAALYDQLLAGELDRGDTVLALGGGVTGDVAGFAAATFMRGVRLVQVPTTLLAMVDASVGGKTGVNLPQGKNLVGAWKFPSLVVMDPTTLLTLPAQEVCSGLAEVIKHGIIGDPELFAELEQGMAQTAMEADRIARALRVKIAVVENDPLEQGHRAVLNLGHTVGHALEQLSHTGLSQYALRHGEAVGLGLVAAARIAVELGRAEAALPVRIERVLSGYDLPVRCPPVEADAILAAMAHDKKKQGRALRWVLPRAVGEVEITPDVPLPVVRSVLCGMGAQSE